MNDAALVPGPPVGHDLRSLGALRSCLYAMGVRAELREHLMGLVVFAPSPVLPVCVFVDGNGQFFTWGSTGERHPVRDARGAACRLAALAGLRLSPRAHPEVARRATGRLSRNQADELGEMMMANGMCASPDQAEKRSALRGYKTFPGRIDQVAEARSFVRRLLGGFPLAEEAVLIASELCANAAVHSQSSGINGWFGVRAEIHPGDFVWLEVEDQGGPWDQPASDENRPRGLEIVGRLAGDDNWGVDGDGISGRVVWARLDWPTTGSQR
jgi:anti-sigma regulatory factor (Ser/Thr protein kinase)